MQLHALSITFLSHVRALSFRVWFEVHVHLPNASGLKSSAGGGLNNVTLATACGGAAAGGGASASGGGASAAGGAASAAGGGASAGGGGAVSVTSSESQGRAHEFSVWFVEWVPKRLGTLSHRFFQDNN
eukprot:1175740-Amphidinium_carterae.1